MIEIKDLEKIIIMSPELEIILKRLLEFFNKLSKETLIKIEDKKDIRQSWKYNTYRRKFNSKILDKRTLHHNCRNNC